MKKKSFLLIMLLLLIIPISAKAGLKDAQCSAIATVCSELCIDKGQASGLDEIDYKANSVCVSACSNDSAAIESCGNTCNSSESCLRSKLCEKSAYQSSGYCTSVLNDRNRFVQSACKAVSYDNRNNTSYSSSISECVQKFGSSSATSMNSLKSEICSDPDYADTTACKYIGDFYQFQNCADNNCSKMPKQNGGSGDEDPEFNASNCYGFGDVVYYTTMIIKIIQLTAPIMLIIWASIDLLRSVISGDEKKIIEKRKPIIQRFIAAALIYLVPWIVMTIVENFSGDNGWLQCLNNNKFETTTGGSGIKPSDQGLKPKDDENSGSNNGSNQNSDSNGNVNGNQSSSGGSSRSGQSGSNSGNSSSSSSGSNSGNSQKSAEEAQREADRKRIEEIQQKEQEERDARRKNIDSIR